MSVAAATRVYLAPFEPRLRLNLAHHGRLSIEHCRRRTADYCRKQNLFQAPIYRRCLPVAQLQVNTKAADIPLISAPDLETIEHHIGSLNITQQSFLLSGLAVDESLLSGAVNFHTAVQDLGATAFTIAGAFAWLRLQNELVARGVFDRKLGRKVTHITTGILLLLCWTLFSDASTARFFAVTPCVTNIARLLAIGLGLVKDDAAVNSISREGNPRELLRGPLFYIIVIAFVTIVYWRQSPVGMIALGMMCGGDGMADIVGRRFGRAKLPYNQSKSWAGSIGMFVFGSIISLGLVYFFCMTGYYSCNAMGTTLRVLLIAAAATVVESLPITEKLDDNFTVPLTAIIMGSFLFPGSEMIG